MLNRVAPACGMVAIWALAGARPAWAQQPIDQADPAAHADDRPSEPSMLEPGGVHPLRQVPIAGSRPAGTWQVAASAGYGRSTGVVDSQDTHQRFAGGLALERWFRGGLALGFSLDGRHDRHARTPGGADDGWTGDPRVFARYAVPSGKRVRVGLLAGLWLPGREAPSLPLDAATPELSALVAWRSLGDRLTLGARGGFRWDRSWKAAPDPTRLTAGDRVSLGISEASAVLLGLTAVWRADRWATHAEASWDLLVGDRAPPLNESPLRVGAGVDRALSASVALGAGVGFTASSHPAQARGVAGAPLVAMPPGFTAGLGLLFRWGGPSPRTVTVPPRAAVVAPVPVPATAAPEAPAETEAPAGDAKPGQLRATVRSTSGRKLDGRLTSPEGVDLPFTKGAFRLELPAGRHELTIQVDGHVTQTRTVELEADGVTVLNLVLTPLRERQR